MKKIILPFLILIFAVACGLPVSAPTEAPISPEIDSPPPPFLGMWMNDIETYVFTETNLYRVIIRPESGQVNEEFSEIILYDPLNNHISLRKVWIRVNGESVGFDSPGYTLTYFIDGDSLQLGLGTETEFASAPDPAVFLRK